MPTIKEVADLAARSASLVRSQSRNCRPGAIAARAADAAEAAQQEKIKRAAEQVTAGAASPNGFGQVDYLRVG